MLTPERLVLARKRRGLTQLRLAELTGCSKSHIEKLERGLTDASVDLRETLAKALDVPLTFLTAPAPPEIPVPRVSFRALTKMTARERDSAISVGTIATAFSAWLDSHFELPQADVPDLSDLPPEAAAENLRAVWRLSDVPIPNMVHLLEAHGVRVFSLAEDTRAVDAFSFMHETRPFVFLNTIKSAERSRFDAAHELGHLVLHRAREADGRLLEEEANAFAAAFLVPRSGVLGRMSRAVSMEDLLRGKRKWGVSLVAFAYRLHDLGLISQWHYKHLCIEFSRMGYRSSEPLPIPRETSQVLKKVFQQMRTRGVGKAEVARELALKVRDLDEMVFGLVLAAVS